MISAMETDNGFVSKVFLPMEFSLSQVD